MYQLVEPRSKPASGLISNPESRRSGRDGTLSFLAHARRHVTATNMIPAATLPEKIRPTCHLADKLGW